MPFLRFQHSGEEEVLIVADSRVNHDHASLWDDWTTRVVVRPGGTLPELVELADSTICRRRTRILIIVGL